jgi:hypothetical protein
MTEKKLPMGKSFKCHLGFFDLPSPIFEIAIHDDKIICECEDGRYCISKVENGHEFYIQRMKDD